MLAISVSPIHISGVSKDFGFTKVLSDISLTIDQGEFVALLGSNGAGKTTLLRMLAGLSTPTSGHISIANVDLRNAGPGLRRRIGFVSHETLLYQDLTARENLVFQARLFGLQNIDEAVDSLSAIVDIAGILDRPVRELSRGNRQRVALARTLMHSPSILLLDEPFTGLDEQSSEQLLKVLRKLVQTGRTVVMTTHDSGLLTVGPSRVLRIGDGSIIEDRPIERFVQDETDLDERFLSPVLHMPPSRLRSAFEIARKDLIIEARTRDLLGSSGLFAIAVLITTAFTLPSGVGATDISTGVLWMSALFATILAVGRSMSRESAESGIESLMLAPIDRESIFLGKALSNLVVVAIVNLISSFLFYLIMSSSTSHINVLQYSLTIVLGTLGLVLVSTLFSIMAIGSRLGESMLPLLVLPVSIPLILGAVELTRIGLGAQSQGMLQWLLLLVIYDAMTGIVAIATFAHIIEE